jgi:hypothetical protein
MDSLNLPMHLAQFADWEYEELVLSGSVTHKLEVNKSGVVPVKQVSGTNIVSLPDPPRAGIQLDVVQAGYSAGTLQIASATGNLYFAALDGTVGPSAQLSFPSTAGYVFSLKSIPIYIGGVRTYRWYVPTPS